MLSLEPCFRRSHGSLYKALDRGGLDTEAIRDLLAAHRPEDWPLVFAVDASIWAAVMPRPARSGVLLLRVKHSAGQPIVAGWSYQWITALDWAHDSWTAPMDATRIPTDTDAVSATATQIRALTTRLTQTQPTRRPETDVCLRRRLRPDRADLRTGRHRGQHGGRIRDDRVFYTHPADPEPAPPGGPAVTANARLR